MINFPCVTKAYQMYTQSLQITRPCLGIGIAFPDVGVFVVEIRRSWDRLVISKGILKPVRWHSRIEPVEIQKWNDAQHGWWYGLYDNIYIYIYMYTFCQMRKYFSTFLLIRIFCLCQVYIGDLRRGDVTSSLSHWSPVFNCVNPLRPKYCWKHIDYWL